MDPGKFISVVCTVLMVTAANPGFAQEGQELQGPEIEEVRGDIGKSIIEMPVEDLLVVDQHTTEGETINLIDLGKKRVEEPTEAVVDVSKRKIEITAEGFLESPAERTLDSAGNVQPVDDDHPSCQPGLVNWHDSFESACIASRQSGKPVMLFQLLGQLDQRFT